MVFYRTTSIELLHFKGLITALVNHQHSSVVHGDIILAQSIMCAQHGRQPMIHPQKCIFSTLQGQSSWSLRVHRTRSRTRTVTHAMPRHAAPGEMGVVDSASRPSTMVMMSDSCMGMQRERGFCVSYLSRNLDKDYI